jgi:signal transduction histidine kinase
LPFAYKVGFGSRLSFVYLIAILGRSQVLQMLKAEIQVTPRMQEICHDMRQPVASVFALAAAALAEPGLPEAACARMEQIIKQAEWLADLIRHALQTAVADSPSSCQSDLVKVARTAVAAECVTWEGEIHLVASAGPVFTAVHPVLLRRMVANLLSNAMRAAGASGRVTLKVGQAEGSARLCVEDTGPGFGKIQKGLGLGLAAVVRDAIKHGGGLECGNGQDGGARVSLTLPIAGAQPTENADDPRITRLV